MKLPGYALPVVPMGLPPCGGSGLKCRIRKAAIGERQSPSMRREWIEISPTYPGVVIAPSPSMRREWIEMLTTTDTTGKTHVSLHAEGVD